MVAGSDYQPHPTVSRPAHLSTALLFSTIRPRLAAHFTDARSKRRLRRACVGTTERVVIAVVDNCVWHIQSSRHTLPAHATIYTSTDHTHSQPMPSQPISPHCSVLYCLLLTAALSSVEVQALLLGNQGAQYKPLDRLFALLGCRVDTVLKSAVLDAINALCTGDRQACIDVWERMERAGMLTRDDGLVGAVGVAGAAAAIGSGVGVWYDVEEVESVQRRYMLTIAFSRLVLTLLSTTPLPPASLSHYLHFSSLTICSYRSATDSTSGQSSVGS